MANRTKINKHVVYCQRRRSIFMCVKKILIFDVIVSHQTQQFVRKVSAVRETHTHTHTHNKVCHLYALSNRFSADFLLQAITNRLCTIKPVTWPLICRPFSNSHPTDRSRNDVMK